MTPAKLFAFAAFAVLPAALFGADAATSAGPAEAAKAVTFAKDIAPIFQEKCQECHRNGSHGAHVAGDLRRDPPLGEVHPAARDYAADAAVAHR